MKTLLAIVHEPKNAENFLRYVAGMAINLGVQIKVKHVHTPANYSVGMADSTGRASIQIKRNQDKLVEEADKTLKAITAVINKEVSNPIFTSTASEIGMPEVIANDLVNKNSVNMVALEGQKDDGFWSQTSSNMDVIKNVKCPVWIIPQGALYKPFTEIVYASDYKKEDIASLKKLIAAFPHYSPNITALHITDSIDFEERVKKAGFVEMLKKETNYKPLWVRAFYQTKDDDLTELVNEFAIKSKADLLVLLKENKTFFEHIFNTSHTKEILKTAQVPVLVYHEK